METFEYCILSEGIIGASVSFRDRTSFMYNCNGPHAETSHLLQTIVSFAKVGAHGEQFRMCSYENYVHLLCLTKILGYLRYEVLSNELIC